MTLSNTYSSPTKPTVPAAVTNAARIFDAASLALIEEHVRRFLNVMSFENVVVTCQEREYQASQAPTGSQLGILIEAGEAGKTLIGPHGAHLDALQHLLRSVLRRQLPAVTFVSVDVNGYRARHEQTLLHIAEAAAEQARHTGQTVVLQPMGSADRRFLHTTLASRSDVTTESQGSEPRRRVVVRPVFL